MERRQNHAVTVNPDTGSAHDPIKYSWTQPICERCWVDKHAVWEKSPDGTEVLIRMPVRANTHKVEQCAYCGQVTLFGVYVREDPKLVAFPQPKDE